MFLRLPNPEQGYRADSLGRMQLARASPRRTEGGRVSPRAGPRVTRFAGRCHPSPLARSLLASYFKTA